MSTGIEILQQLNPQQQKAVQATEGPVLVLAGAGSGKTRTLTARIAYLIAEKRVEPHKILAVTFTNKAAGEMRARVGEMLGMEITPTLPWQTNSNKPELGTFHSVSARILREDAEVLGYTANFTIYDTDDQIKAMRQVVNEMNLSTKEYNPKLLLYSIERAKRELVGPDRFGEKFSDTLEDPIASIAEDAYKMYQKNLKESNAMDFGDLLFLCVKLWQDNPDVLRKYQERWKYVLVDEYQDTNYVQYEWCRLLVQKHKNLFVVGDDYQSIYAFRGADISNILNFNKDYPEAEVILLEQNYRSTKRILNIANDLIAQNSGQQKKNLWTQNVDGILPKIVEVDDEEEEGAYVIREIAGESHGGDVIFETVASRRSPEGVEYDFSDTQLDEDDVEEGGVMGILDRVMAVERGKPITARTIRPLPNIRDAELQDYVILYRTNAQSRAIEEMLLQHRIPYQIIGGVRFYERKEIKDVIAYIRILANPKDWVSVERIINVPARGIGAKSFTTLLAYLKNNNLSVVEGAKQIMSSPAAFPQLKRAFPFCELVVSIADDIKNLTVAELIEVILLRTGYKQALKNTFENFDERMQNIKELKTVAERFSEAHGEEGLRAFLEEVALVSDVDALVSNGQKLTLMTTHSAKGLEFPHVFMIGMEQGLLPHQNSLMSKDDLEEERRLCYVGITRAKETLHFIHTRKRNLYGTTLFPEPSEFIADLGDGVVERIAL